MLMLYSVWASVFSKLFFRVINKTHKPHPVLSLDFRTLPSVFLHTHTVFDWLPTTEQGEAGTVLT